MGLPAWNEQQYIAGMNNSKGVGMGILGCSKESFVPGGDRSPATNFANFMRSPWFSANFLAFPEKKRAANLFFMMQMLNA